jgi:altronate dehydratase large subunit
VTSLQFSGFDRGARGAGVRDHVLVLPSVGCTNRTVELIARRFRSVRHLTHQHGCAQLGDDLALSRQVLAGVAANPNVRAAVVVGLGCESNQADVLADAVRNRGGRAEVAVLQVAGGIEGTIAAAGAIIERLNAEAAARVGFDAASLTVGVVADSSAGELGESICAATAASLQAEGVRVVSQLLRDGRRAQDSPGSPERVEELWLSRSPAPLRADFALVSSDNPAEALALLAARGAQLCVHVTGRATPLGSPVLPTLKVGVDAALRGLDIIDVDVSVCAHDPASAASLLLPAVLGVAGGDETAAERWGQRDFGIPRVAPSM